MGLKVDSTQQKPSLADDEKFRDRLLELDRGLGVRDPADEHPTRPLAKAPARPEPAAGPSPSELPIPSFGRPTQALMDAIDRREGVMVVTGENGTGKTTLCLSLVGQIGGATRPSLLTDPPSSVRELFEAVQGSAVVVIDEAQRLSLDA